MRMLLVGILFSPVLAACGGGIAEAPPTTDATEPTSDVTEVQTEPTETAVTTPRTAGPESDAAKTLRVMLASIEYARSLANVGLTLGGEIGDTESRACRDTYEEFGDYAVELSGELVGVSVPVVVDDELDDAEQRVFDALEDCIDQRPRAVERLEEAGEALKEAALLIVPEL